MLAAKRAGKIIVYIICSLIGLVVLAFVVMYALFFISTEKQKRYIDQHYAVSFPSIIQYKNRVWDAGGVDVQANWTYSYSTNVNRTTAYNAIQSTLQKNDYVITQGTCPFDDGLYAYNKNAGIDLTIYINPQNDDTSIPPSINVSSIQIYAEENHDDVYVDPNALTCAPVTSFSP